ncbi:hypothetical protein EVAR_23056_1 [Eumeta japonica]|uniref:Uncharacterized protein n=1 Tax=Eumeta variegata TaxID=151549 RepID=A0A4C1VM88_EUMVA|nr:hypothetical protein EVAR_23056_1 [Eumeta japonica]
MINTMFRQADPFPILEKLAKLRFSLSYLCVLNSDNPVMCRRNSLHLITTTSSTSTYLLCLLIFRLNTLFITSQMASLWLATGGFLASHTPPSPYLDFKQEQLLDRRLFEFAFLITSFYRTKRPKQNSACGRRAAGGGGAAAAADIDMSDLRFAPQAGAGGPAGDFVYYTNIVFSEAKRRNLL